MAEDLFESRQWLSGPDWLSQADPPSSDAGELTCTVSDAQDEPFSAGELPATSVETDESSDCGVALCAPSNGGELESPSSDDVAEAVASEAVLQGAAAASRPDSSPGNVPAQVINIDRFGSLTRATRVMGWALRFIQNARGTSRCCEGDLTGVEMDSARNTLFRLVQAESFPAEVTA